MSYPPTSPNTGEAARYGGLRSTVNTLLRNVSQTSGSFLPGFDAANSNSDNTGNHVNEDGVQHTDSTTGLNISSDYYPANTSSYTDASGYPPQDPNRYPDDYTVDGLQQRQSDPLNPNSYSSNYNDNNFQLSDHRTDHIYAGNPASYDVDSNIQMRQSSGYTMHIPPQEINQNQLQLPATATQDRIGDANPQGGNVHSCFLRLRGKTQWKSMMHRVDKCSTTTGFRIITSSEPDVPRFNQEWPIAFDSITDGVDHALSLDSQTRFGQFVFRLARTALEKCMPGYKTMGPGDIRRALFRDPSFRSFYLWLRNELKDTWGDVANHYTHETEEIRKTHGTGLVGAILHSDLNDQHTYLLTDPSNDGLQSLAPSDLLSPISYYFNKCLYLQAPYDFTGEYLEERSTLEPDQDGPFDYFDRRMLTLGPASIGVVLAVDSGLINEFHAIQRCFEDDDDSRFIHFLIDLFKQWKWMCADHSFRSNIGGWLTPYYDTVLFVVKRDIVEELRGRIADGRNQSELKTQVKYPEPFSKPNKDVGHHIARLMLHVQLCNGLDLSGKRSKAGPWLNHVPQPQEASRPVKRKIGALGPDVSRQELMGGGGQSANAWTGGSFPRTQIASNAQQQPQGLMGGGPGQSANAWTGGSFPRTPMASDSQQQPPRKTGGGKHKR